MEQLQDKQSEGEEQNGSEWDNMEPTAEEEAPQKESDAIKAKIEEAKRQLAELGDESEDDDEATRDQRDKLDYDIFELERSLCPVVVDETAELLPEDKREEFSRIMPWCFYWEQCCNAVQKTSEGKTKRQVLEDLMQEKWDRKVDDDEEEKFKQAKAIYGVAMRYMGVEDLYGDIPRESSEELAKKMDGIINIFSSLKETYGEDDIPEEILAKLEHDHREAKIAFDLAERAEIADSLPQKNRKEFLELTDEMRMLHDGRTLMRMIDGIHAGKSKDEIVKSEVEEYRPTEDEVEEAQKHFEFIYETAVRLTQE